MAEPTNKNFLSPLSFKFSMERAPNLSYFVQSATVPALTLGNPYLDTPFVRVPVAGDRLFFNELTITYRVDEDMLNYLEMYNWLVQLGFPESFEQYTLSYNAGGGGTSESLVFTDATLTVLTNTMNPNYDIKFRDMYPLSLSELQFDSKDQDVDYVEATVTFAYKDFVIEKISS